MNFESYLENSMNLDIH